MAVTHERGIWVYGSKEMPSRAPSTLIGTQVGVLVHEYWADIHRSTRIISGIIPQLSVAAEDWRP